MTIQRILPLLCIFTIISAYGMQQQTTVPNITPTIEYVYINGAELNRRLKKSEGIIDQKISQWISEKFGDTHMDPANVRVFLMNYICGEYIPFLQAKYEADPVMKIQHKNGSSYHACLSACKTCVLQQVDEITSLILNTNQEVSVKIFERLELYINSLNSSEKAQAHKKLFKIISAGRSVVED
ncbi:MAG: hypothetical protein UU47_C0015G0007 [candidate division TM6 bacterium GW2011_GWE2_41_16]|nr:MAG: hypothetical protein UU47_C0015G0007 [candidate division TM6 bacterium GW2011_GWE2_41_16]